MERKQKQCILCGKMFTPTHNAQRICSDYHYRKCKVCGKEFPIKRPTDSQQCCSKACTVKLRETTMLKRHGVKHALQNPQFLEKAQSTTLEHFGVKHPAQAPEIQKKTEEQFVQKYGVTTPFLMEDFRQKSMETCAERYGVRFTAQVPGRTEKMQATNLQRYGSTSPIGNPEIRERIQATMIKKYGAPYYWVTDDCLRKQHNYISQTNKRFAKVMESEYGVTPEFEFLISGKRYDLFVPDRHLLLEINPTDTHNAMKTPWTNEGLPRRYHLEKSKLAESHGYRCVHIFQWDDADKVLDMLFSQKKTVYARKCNLMEIDAKTASVFETLYHLQGKCSGQSYCLGLYYQGELIQLMTFGRPRYNRKFQWELLRLCTNSKFRVVGGAERLFHHFLEEKKPESIISYCDRSKFTGEVYTRLGFELYSTSDPNMIWSQGTKRVTNNLLLQRGYDQLFNANYGKGTSNNELMLADGWLPVYDCGQSVYIMRLSRDESK